MSVNLIINIILFVSLIGIIIIVARRLPEIADLDTSEYAGHVSLPKNDISSKIYFWFRSLWLSILHVKGVVAHSNSPKRLQKLIYKRNIMQQSDESANGGVSEGQAVEFELKKQNLLDDTWPLEHSLGEVEKNIKLGSWKSALLWLNRIDGSIIRADSALLAKKAQVYLMLEDFDKAVIYYQKSLELDDTNATRYYNLTVALIRLMRYAEALNYIKTACELLPENQKYLNVKDDLESAVVAQQVEQFHGKE